MGCVTRAAALYNNSNHDCETCAHNNLLNEKSTSGGGSQWSHVLSMVETHFPLRIFFKYHHKVTQEIQSNLICCTMCVNSGSSGFSNQMLMMWCRLKLDG